MKSTSHKLNMKNRKLTKKNDKSSKITSVGYTSRPDGTYVTHAKIVDVNPGVGKYEPLKMKLTSSKFSGGSLDCVLEKDIFEFMLSCNTNSRSHLKGQFVPVYKRKNQYLLYKGIH